MFKTNDKSFYIIRKFINWALFILMCIAVIAGIIMMSSSFYTVTPKYGSSYVDMDAILFFSGLLTMLLGPVILQFNWLLIDAFFNFLFDVKIIRNATSGAPIPELPAPILFRKKKESDNVVVDAYEKLKMYKALCDEGVLTEAEFNDIKRDLLNKNVAEKQSFESDIDKVKKLKVYLDEKVLTEQEFVAEKSKILKK